MEHAINISTISVPANLARGGRGGARNFRDQETNALTLAHVKKLVAAEAHSRAIALPLNRMITIHWEGAGVPLREMPRATAKFLDLLTKAAVRAGFSTAYIWVLESGEGKGGHCHVMAHVTPQLVKRLPAIQKRWLRSISGRSYRRGVIHSDAIGRRLGIDTANPELHMANVQETLRYLLKGAEKEAARMFNLTRLEPGGLVVGKRCGFSENLGPTARARGRSTATIQN